MKILHLLVAFTSLAGCMAKGGPSADKLGEQAKGESSAEKPGEQAKANYFTTKHGWQKIDNHVTAKPGGQTAGISSLGGIRLVSGSSYYGRVEVYYSGQWGTVCDDNWGINDAHVACHQLGFASAIASRTNAYYGQGSGPIWMDSVGCYGYETSLDQCYHKGFGNHDCTHSEDAGVYCDVNTPFTQVPVTRWGNIQDIRLVRGSSSYGRLEILYDNQWGTICHDSWSQTDSNVACRQLGFSRANNTYYSAYFGQGSGPIWMDNVGCYGYESSLQYCYHNGFGVHNCGHYKDVGVSCEGFGTNTTTGNTTAMPEDDIDVVKLHCGSSTFQVDIPNHMVTSSTSASDLYLAGAPNDTSCHGFNNGGHISLNSSLDGCGTQYSENYNVSYYRNTVISGGDDPDAIVEYLSLQIPITCEYKRSKVLKSHFRALEDIIRMKERGDFNYDFAIYSDIGYNHRYETYPVVVSLSTELFFRAELLDPPANLEIHLRSCRATPSADYDDETVYEFIRDGCGVNNAAVRVLSPNISSQADFELTSFQFRYDLRSNNSDEVWVHCDVIFCDIDDVFSECQSGCEEGRHRRSARQASQPARRIVKGPIILKEARRDVNVAVEGYNEKFNTGGEDAGSVPIAILMTVSTVMLVAMVTMGVALMFVIRRLRLSGYQSVSNPAEARPA